MKRCAFLLMLMLSVVTIRAQYVASLQPQQYDKTLHWGGAFQPLQAGSGDDVLGDGVQDAG